MDMFGYPMWLQDLHLMVLTAIGYLPMLDGHGFLIIRGDGHHFIMVVGTTILFMDRYGFRVTNGDLDGLRGECLMVIMDGHQLDLELVLILHIVVDIIYLIISGYL